MTTLFFSHLHHFTSSLESSVESSLSAARRVHEGVGYATSSEREQQRTNQARVWRSLLQQTEEIRLKLEQMNKEVYGERQQQTEEESPAPTQLQSLCVALPLQLARMREQSQQMQRYMDDKKQMIVEQIAQAEAATIQANEAEQEAMGDENATPLQQQQSSSATPSLRKGLLSSNSAHAFTSPPARGQHMHSAMYTPIHSNEQEQQLCLETPQYSSQQQQYREEEYDMEEADLESESFDDMPHATRCLQQEMEEQDADTVIEEEEEVAPQVQETPQQKQANKSSLLLDSPPTPEFVSRGLSEATRRLLEQSMASLSTRPSVTTSSLASKPLATASTGALSGSSSSSSSSHPLSTPARPSHVRPGVAPTPGARPAPSLTVDSPPTPELASVQLALHMAQGRSSKKNGAPSVSATPATSRKIGGGVTHMAPRTPGAVATPARVLFTTTPMSHRARSALKSAQRPTTTTSHTPRSTATTSAVHPDLLQPLRFNSYLTSNSSSGLDDSHSMSMSDSLIATPELTSNLTGLLHRGMNGEASQGTRLDLDVSADMPSPGFIEPKSAKKTNTHSQPMSWQQEEPMPSAPSFPCSSPAPAHTLSSLSARTPRSGRKKGILKTPKSSMRKSARLAAKSPAPQPLAAEFTLTPEKKTSAGFQEVATPMTPPSPLLLSSLSSALAKQ